MDKTRICASFKDLEDLQKKLEALSTETGVEYLGKVVTTNMGYTLDGVAMLIYFLKLETLNNFKTRLLLNPDDENREAIEELITYLEEEPVYWRMKAILRDTE